MQDITTFLKGNKITSSKGYYKVKFIFEIDWWRNLTQQAIVGGIMICLDWSGWIMTYLAFLDQIMLTNLWKIFCIKFDAISNFGVKSRSHLKKLSLPCKRFSNKDITILSMNKTQKYLRYWVQIYCGCSASITFYEWNSISVIWPPRARLQRSILWTQFSTTLAHILTETLAISRWMLSLRSSKVAGLLA